MKKPLSAALALAICTALALSAAPAANAAPPATLPPGETLYAIDCDAFGLQLWSLAPNGAGTPIGTTAANNDCAGGGQVNPVTGVAYFIAYPVVGADYLATVNLTTGAITVIAPFSGAINTGWQLFITNSGAAFVVDGSSLYSLSLTTAVTTLIGSIAPVNAGAVGYDSFTDTIYAFDYGNTVSIYTINRTTGVATITGLGGNWPAATCLNGGTEPGSPDGVAFDSAGFAWIQSDSCDSNIISVDMSTGASSMMGELYDATGTLYTTAPNDFYSETFLIGGAALVTAPAAAPGLAATGFNTSAIALAGGIGALAVLAGIVFVARGRRVS